MSVLGTATVLDDDGVIVITTTASSSRIADLSYPETVLAAMREAALVAFETGYEDTFTVRVRDDVAKAKKTELRGPFPLRIEKGARLSVRSYGEWTRGELGEVIDLAPGIYDVTIRGVEDEKGLSFDVSLTRRAASAKKNAVKKLPSFSTDPLDVHPTAAMTLGLAVEMLLPKKLVPGKGYVDVGPPSPERRTIAELRTRIARKHYAALGARGKRALEIVDKVMTEHGLKDGPIDL